MNIIKKQFLNKRLFLLLFILTAITIIQTVSAFESPTIETDRIILRLIKLDDANEVFEFTSDPEVAKLTGMFKLHKTLQDTHDFIEKNLKSYQNKATITWVIVDKLKNKVIGIFSFFNYIPTHFKAEIGYTINRSYWNQGIATQATIAVLSYCFNKLGMNRMQATFDPRNIASRRVLEKTGFKHEGYLRSYYYLNNEFCDRIIYSILKPEFII